MSRRVAPILKDVIPPWTLGPVGGNKKRRRAVVTKQGPPMARLDPNCPKEFVRSCLPPNARIVQGPKSEVQRPVQASAPAAAPLAPLKLFPPPHGVCLPVPPPGTKRHIAWVNQNGRCHYCTWLTPLEQWTLDHKIARAKGGRNHPSNRVGSCYGCNKAKRTLSSEEFLATEYIGGAGRRGRHEQGRRKNEE